MSNRRNREDTDNKFVIIMATNAIKFPEIQAFWIPCRKENQYSMLFSINEENLLASCLKANPKGAVCIFNLETKHVVLLKGKFTQVKVNKSQLYDYYIQHEEIKQRGNQVLFEFHTITKEDL